MKPPVFHDYVHQAFYYRMLAERRCTDSYHRALFYTLGLSKDTRAHIQELFDFSDPRDSLLKDVWHTTCCFQNPVY